MAKNTISVVGLSPHEILGIHPGASREEARGAMKLLARQVHPDLFPRGSALFQIVNAALDAVESGAGWPHGIPIGIAGRPYNPPVPKAPPAPAKGREAGATWRQSPRGNWSLRAGRDSYLTVFLKDDGWHWVVPGPIYSTEVFESAIDAQEDVCGYWGI